MGPYRLGRVLGVGGMGEVYEAYDTRLGRQVAMKRIRPDRLGSDDDSLARFRREARIVASLNHPGIVQIHDVLQSEGSEWLVMERVDGRSLAELLRRHGAMDEGRVRRLGRQIAEALAAAHGRGIVHRDLKPGNVLLTVGPDGLEQVKILDFGVAKRLRGAPEPAGETSGSSLPPEQSSLELTSVGGLVGTYRSMSPEQSRGQPVDPRSDLFSLGVLLYEMLSGTSPFRAETLERTLERLRSHRQQPLCEVTGGAVSEALSELVDELLEKDPARRPSTAHHVADLLGASGRVDDGAELYAAESTVRDDPAVDGAATSHSLRGWIAALSLLAILGTLWLARQYRGLDDRPATSVPGSQEAAAAPIYAAVASPWFDAARQPQPPPLVVEAVADAMLDGLLALDGLAVVTEDTYDGGETSSRARALALARRLAADEAVSSELSCGEGSACRVHLQRLAAGDGRLLWSQSFDVAGDDVLLLSGAIAARVRSAYGGHPVRDGAQGLELDAESYREFLELSRSHDARSLDFQQLAERLDALQLRVPGFAGLYLLEADAAYRHYFHSRRDEELKRALDNLRLAQRLDPTDPLPFFRLARIAVEEGRLNLARDAIERLHALLPGDARIGIYEALLYERTGRPQDALATMRRSVELHPSWRTLYESARLEYRAGRVEQSRQDLQALIRLAPEQITAREFLARIELVEGRLAAAEVQYLLLVEQGLDGVAELSNLGLVRMLLGRYDPAVDSFRRARELAPDNPVMNLNLADALELAGHAAEATELYATVVELTRSATEAQPGTAGEGWQTLTVRAQALAHLGRKPEAASTIQRALASGVDHPQIAYEACLVYCLLGETSSALASARTALASFGTEWFALPWFDGLRELPDFQQLVAESAAAPEGSDGS